MVFWDGKSEELDHFLRGMAEFPSALVIVSPRFRDRKEIADRLGRNVIFMELEDAMVLFKPDFAFHYSKSGASSEEIAVKLKQSFSVLVAFGKKSGDPVSLQKFVSNSTAPVILVYEVLKLLRGF